MLKVKIALFQQSSRYNRITSLKSILHYVNNDVFRQILSTLLVQKAGSSHHLSRTYRFRIIVKAVRHFSAIFQVHPSQDSQVLGTRPTPESQLA